MKREILIFILVFAVGTFAGSFLDFSYYFGLFFVFLGGVFFVFFYLLKCVRLVSVLILIFLAFGSGLFWYGVRENWSRQNVSVFGNKIGSHVNLSGIIDDEPDERENYTRLIFKTKERVRILVYAERFPGFRYGDEIKVEGVLKKPSSFAKATDGKNDFSWSAYLAKDDVYYEMFYPEIELLSSGHGFWIKRQLLALKEKFLSTISQLIPEPHSALLGGLTVGARRSISKELQEDFRKTGIIHIVVLSGYNVTIVAYVIMGVFSFLPFIFGLGLGILGIIFFALMTGASATVVRASLMAILVLFARTTGRVYQITTALFMAGFFMILHNPKILRFDSSFQLSFLATLALIYLAPLLEPYLKFLPKKWKIKEIVAATISTQIFVLPLLLYKMGLFSLVSLPVNLLILIFVPATMFFGFITACAGFISISLALPLSWITYGLLQYELKVVELFASLPFAAFHISVFPLWLMILMYVGYAAIIYKLTKK